MQKKENKNILKVLRPEMYITQKIFHEKDYVQHLYAYIIRVVQYHLLSKFNAKLRKKKTLCMEKIRSKNY